MSLKTKVKFIMNNPGILLKYFKLKKELKRNKTLGKYNLVFQCDVPMHFNCLEPYYNALKNESNIIIYFSGNFNGNGTPKKLLESGIPSDKIIENIELVGNADWDIYMSPTSWGNVFPKNTNCARIQIFHTLADKNIQYGENLLPFNIIFVCGPIHHEILEKYLFSKLPESRKNCKTYNVGYAKIDDLFGNKYSIEQLKMKLKISLDDERKIILYAPNWEKTSALHKYGRQVFEALKNTKHIVLIKLHYMSLLSPDDDYATGGIDWKKLLKEYEKFENIRIIGDQNINPYLFLADLLITDYGGVAYEYICTKKPIIYLDCPEFFKLRGKDIMEYWSRDTDSILLNTDDISSFIDKSFNVDKDNRKFHQDIVERILYNPGKGAHTGKKVILEQILKVNQ